VDRWYIERFLAEHEASITGRVLEVKDSGYTDRFGTGVTERGVLDVDVDNPHATYRTDLASGRGPARRPFRLLHPDPDAAVPLRPGGRVCSRCTARFGRAGRVLATLPVVSRITDPPLTDFWRFTPLVASRLFAGVFGEANVVVRGRGSVLTEVAFLEGLGVEELDPAKVVVDDERFPLIVTVRAVKAPT
jgi:hypothetical protein